MQYLSWLSFMFTSSLPFSFSIKKNHCTDRSECVSESASVSATVWVRCMQIIFDIWQKWRSFEIPQCTQWLPLQNPQRPNLSTTAAGVCRLVTSIDSMPFFFCNFDQSKTDRGYDVSSLCMFGTKPFRRTKLKTRPTAYKASSASPLRFKGCVDFISFAH